MSNLTLTVRVTLGTRIADAAQEAVGLARKLGISIDFDFNGYEVHVSPFPNATVEEVVDQYVANYRQFCRDNEVKR